MGKLMQSELVDKLRRNAESAGGTFRLPIKAALAELDIREERIAKLRAAIVTIIRHGVAHGVDLRKVLVDDASLEVRGKEKSYGE